MAERERWRGLLLPKRVSDVIADCWESAEKATIAVIKERYWAPNEEQVTFLLCGELRFAVEGANQANAFQKAFEAELLEISPAALSTTIKRRSMAGLIGSISFHRRHFEGHHSGADFGVVIGRPDIRVSGSGATLFRTKQSVLLAQAKLKRPTGTTCELTEFQEQTITSRAGDYAVLIYRIGGDELNDLASFEWYPTKGHGVSEIRDWLRKGKFPDEGLRSRNVIERLSRGNIGSDNPLARENAIDPSGHPNTIEIRVQWPTDKGPKDGMRLMTRENTRTQAHIHLQS